MINNTGVSQEIIGLTGTFFDDRGQMIASEFQVLGYWPFVDVLPAGGSVPFELTVIGTESAANYELSIDAEASQEIWSHDFEFLDLNQTDDNGLYCVGGRLRNPGDPLQSAVTIALTLYNEQDQVINFSDYYEPSATHVGSDQTLAFDICVDPRDQVVARHELRAWGQ